MTDVPSAPKFRVTYDGAADVLYMTRRPGAPARSREEAPGLVWRYDAASDDLVGLTIIDFERYWGSRREQLIRQISRRFEITSREAENLVGRKAVA